MKMNMHDADIVTRDPALPGLRLLLDSRALLGALRTLTPLRDAVTLDIAYLRYKPATSCVAGLTMTFNDGEIRHYFAKAMTLSRFQQSWLHPKRQALITARDPRAPQALPDEAIMIQHPAFDRAIRFLSLLEDGKRQALLRMLLPALPDPQQVEWRFLRYKPERRAVVALYRQETPLGVLRVASKKEYGRMLQGSMIGAALGHISLVTSKGDCRMLLTHWLAGESLGPEHGGKLAARDMSEAGIVLAQLHQTPFTPPVVRSSDDDIQALWRVFTTLGVIWPAGAGRFQKIAHRVAGYIRTQSHRPALIHGDFSADQLIKPDGGGRLRIIDWDRSCYGNPLADTGCFCARLEMQSLTGLITHQQAADAMSSFIAGYRSLCDLDDASLLWYNAWALLCLAAEPFRRRAADWPQQTERALERAGQLAEKAEALNSSRVRDAAITMLCESESIAPSLFSALGLPPDSPLPHARLMRHKPGRRALVEYQLSSLRSVLGKYRHKGLDRHGFQCQLALWQKGFREQAAVIVPQPLAVLPEWNLWLQEKVDARPLTQLLCPDNPQLARLGELTGHALAKVQQCAELCAVAATKEWQIDDELRVLAFGLHEVATLYPHWRPRLNKLLADCTALSLPLADETRGCTHRDFYPDQVMLNDSGSGQLVFLDFDLCCLSFPALDAGNYLAHVRELALRRYHHPGALVKHERAFTESWLAHSAASLTAINKFTTLSLVRHIFISTRFTDRTHTTPALINECEQQLQRWLTIQDREIPEA